MSYLVLARKWRPQTFTDLVGQEHVAQTLKNAINSGRVAHAFLFTGARGVGKTSSARILAKALNCEQGPTPTPCNECPTCREITTGTAVDVLEIDGASNTGVDDVRELRENVKYLPSRSRYKIFIIDEVHMLSTSAFNALLKTLEEPPAHVKFIFATTEPHKLPITILSRCQRFDFKRIPLRTVVDRLRYIADQEEIAISDDALVLVARKGDGSMRDSLSTMDQVLAFCGNDVRDEEIAALLGVVDRQLLVETAAAVLARDPQQAMASVSRVDAYGFSMRHFCQELVDHFRNLMVTKVAPKEHSLVDLAETELATVREQAAEAPLEDIQRHLTILMKAESEIAHAGFPRVVLEMALVKMATLPPLVPVQELLERLRRLEEGGRTAGVAAPAQRYEAAPAPSRPRYETASAPSRPAPVERPQETERPAASEPAAPSADAEPLAGAAATEKGWEGFVAFVKSRKIGLGSILEHGWPLTLSAQKIEIGFPSDSFHLTRLKDDPEAIETLKGFAAQFFKATPNVSVTGSSDRPGTTLVEKKKLERTERSRQLKEDVQKHPLVSAALEIFGGEVTVAEDEKTRK